MEALSHLKINEGWEDPGSIYRNLRRMEEEGLVESEWDTPGRGPARRRYRITPQGLERLDAWSRTIRHRRDSLDEFLRVYEKLRQERGGMEV